MAQFDRRYSIWTLLDEGKRFQPDKIKVTYRYKKTYTDLASVYVFGLEPDKTTPTLMATAYVLPASTCPRERYMSTVIELLNYIKVCDIWVMIAHYESLEDVLNITAVYDKKEIPHGKPATVTAFNCGT